MLKFYITRALRIIGFLNERFEQADNAVSPILTLSWWMLMDVFAPVIAIINETIVKL
jgi:hypothetical protein